MKALAKCLRPISFPSITTFMVSLCCNWVQYSMEHKQPRSWPCRNIVGICSVPTKNTQHNPIIISTQIWRKEEWISGNMTIRLQKRGQRQKSAEPREEKGKAWPFPSRLALGDREERDGTPVPKESWSLWHTLNGNSRRGNLVLQDTPHREPNLWICCTHRHSLPPNSPLRWPSLKLEHSPAALNTHVALSSCVFPLHPYPKLPT